MGFEHRRQLAEAAAFRVEPVPGRGLQRQQVEPALAHRLLPFTALRQAALATAGGLEGLQPLRAGTRLAGRGFAQAAQAQRRPGAAQQLVGRVEVKVAQHLHARRHAGERRQQGQPRGQIARVGAGQGEFQLGFRGCRGRAAGLHAGWVVPVVRLRAKSASSPGVAGAGSYEKRSFSRGARKGGTQRCSTGASVSADPGPSSHRRRAGSARSCSRRGR